ncbi:extracellular solute-binding protein [Streptomyces sp. AJS327]|uniref:ABC transporter substrate-binding protein n=1 Tax=Streptomyces sp. AJS327 TaxID=2545265 RepID=UPI0015DE2D4F|nr:extracellular solute-binding protein [Streptomyces sp. AJS327]MBA0049888.1 extracellular solute-binding protein [Streptomyces sp. AJS327]
MRRPQSVPLTPGAVLLAAVTVLALLVTACVPGTQGPAGDGAGGPGGATTDPGAAGKITLKVWDQEVRGGQNAEIERLNAKFEEKYPNVTIKRTSRSFSDLKTTLKLALSGSNPPDVVQANQGYGDMVSFVRAGLLTPLDGYAGSYGWNTRYPQALLDLNRVSADTRSFGTGRLYGLSQAGEYLGLYYNKELLRELDIEPPRTWDEFTRQLPRIKKAGELPVQFGNLDKYPAIHTFGAVLDQLADKDEQRDAIFGRGERGSWDTEEVREAAGTLRAWTRAGHLPKDANGQGHDAAAKDFAGGEGAYLLTGTWQLADLKKTMGEDLGFMPLPPAEPGGPSVTTGGQGLAWTVTSEAKQPGVAAAYIDFLTGERAAQVMTEEGVLPVVPGKSPKKGTVERQMFDGWRRLVADDGLVPYLDYATTTFYDTLSAGLQNVLSGRTSPGKFAEELQKDYTAFHRERR